MMKILSAGLPCEPLLSACSSQSVLPQQAAMDENPCDSRTLLRAFMKGAGVPGVALPAELTPEWMEMIGKMLAVAVEGTVDLAVLRSLVKREANADRTMVVIRNNNPLKFFSDGKTVLTQMLRKRMPGFMGPVEAMQDAYEDLHAHQLGVVAGTRAAMAGILKRINPDAIEREIPPRPLLDRILPSWRKARMWDRHKKRFQKLRHESRDDFQSLFGKAFLDAYEKEVECYKSDASHA
jgi:FHA domain-containing protein